LKLCERTWTDFNVEENCVPLYSGEQVRPYLAQARQALRCLDRVLVPRGEADLEARSVRGFLGRLSSTLELLGLRHMYPTPDLPLKVDSTDSGFLHFSMLLDLQADLAERDTLLRGLPSVAETKREMAEAIVRHQACVRSLQRRLARRLYLERLCEDDVFEAFQEGPLVDMVAAQGTANSLWSFATYDRALNRPFVYLIYFGCEGDEPLEVDSEGYRALVEASRRLASGSRTLLAFAAELDEALPGIHPRIVKRLVLGPYWAPGVTALPPELEELLDGAGERQPFALRWETETLISGREARVGGGLLSRGRLRQVFWLPKEPGLHRRGVSRLVRAVLVPHWLGQRLAEENIWTDHRRYVVDAGNEVHGIH
jgi:hypothetical protein